MSANVLRPEDLRKITEDKEMAKVRESLAHKKKEDEEQQHLREAFMAGDMRDQRHGSAERRRPPRRRAEPERADGDELSFRLVHGPRPHDQQRRARTGRTPCRAAPGKATSSTSRT